MDTIDEKVKDHRILKAIGKTFVIAGTLAGMAYLGKKTYDFFNYKTQEQQDTANKAGSDEYSDMYDQMSG